MRILACLVSVLVLAGCGGDGDAPAPASTHLADLADPTGAERDYVNQVGAWVLLIGDESDCGGSLREYAGEAPSTRLARLEDAAVAACRGDRSVDSVVTIVSGYEFHWGETRRLPVKGGRTSDSRIEPRLSEAGRKLTGRRTEVRCWSEEDWRAVAAAGVPYAGDDEDSAAEVAGFVGDNATLNLSPNVCAALVRLVYGREDDVGFDLAFAVGTFAHEARHRMGELREGHTECWAVQHVRRTARLFGASQPLADELADFYWEEIYPEEEPPYFDERCHDGGALDLRPESSVWP